MRNRRTDSSKCNCKCAVKWSLFGTNLAIFLLGVGLLIAGLVLLLDSNLREIRRNLQLFDSYKYAAILAIIIATLITIAGFLGCTGSYAKSNKLLIAYNIVMGILVMLEVATVVLVWRNANTEKTVNLLGNPIKEMIKSSINGKTDADNFLDTIQRKLKCCGGFGYYDYADLQVPIRESCFLEGTVDVMVEGCARAIQQHFIKSSLALGLTILAIMIGQIACIAFAWLIFCSTRQISRHTEV